MTGSSAIVDSNIFINLMKGDAIIAAKLENLREIYLSPIVWAELNFGAFRSANPPRHLAKIEMAVKQAKLLVIDDITAELFVSIKLHLFAKGTPIPENDIWIAASALQHKLSIYTNDSHFNKIDNLNLL